MIDDAPLPGDPANDARDTLDEVVSAARGRVPWLVGFLELRRRRPRRSVSVGPLHIEFQEQQAQSEAAWAGTTARLALSTEEEWRAAILCLALAGGLDARDSLRAREVIGAFGPQVHGWAADEVTVMLRHACTRQQGALPLDALRVALDVAEQLDADACRAVAPWLRHAHAELMAAEIDGGRREPLVARLRRLLGRVDEAGIPEGMIPAYAPWAAPLRERTGAAVTPELAALVRHVAALSGPRPTQRWRSVCPGLVDAAAARGLVAEVLRVLAEGEPVCARSHGAHLNWIGDGHHYHYLVHQSDADLARGLVWAATLTGGAAAVPQLTALALRAGGPGSDVTEDLKLAGAAINALAEVADPAALEALWRLRAAIRQRALRKQVDTALVTASGRLGITPAQLVERSVPDHGLGSDGALERTLGSCRARVQIEDGTTVRLTFTTPDGRSSRTVPGALKDGCPDALKQLKALVKEVRGTLGAERARIEGLMAADRSWPYEDWSRHYRDHPVTGALVRGLIWEFRDPEDAEWRAVAPGAEPPGAPAHVRLWHPVRASAAEIGSWRERIVADRLKQPFKQAFREIYLLTPAEQETGGYSNRFAAHIVHYQQLYALFKQRGWQANHLGAHSGGYDGEARGEFGDGEWRACFHHEPAGDEVGWSPQHATTDQVRFERREGRRRRRAQLAEVPPMVFSEAMRDVDLFVAVTSIAADPSWEDRGEDRYARYWRSAGFGELTASAELRREALERILPRLRIADRCSLDGRFLVVRGELATYRIHLGSANILMEPGGSYLCIVPARRAAPEGKVFLPFEDERLSLILSKAALLAADTGITDESILAQIRRGA